MRDDDPRDPEAAERALRRRVVGSEVLRRLTEGEEEPDEEVDQLGERPQRNAGRRARPEIH